MMPPQLTIKTLWALIVAGLFGLLLIFAGVQTARIEGFKIWPINVKGLKAQNRDLQNQLEDLKKAQAQAARAQKAVNDTATEKYKTIAKGVDDEARKSLPVELGAADRYIAGHRLRTPRSGGAPGYAAASAHGDSPRDTQGAGATSQLDDANGAAPYAPGMVAVSEDDVKLCTANTVKAEAGHNLATALEAANEGR